MKTRMKLIALIMALAMTLAVAGCGAQGDTSWAARLGEETLPAGVYVTYLMMGYQNADSALEGDYDQLLREKIDGQPVTTYIVDYAKKQSAQMLALRQRYQELNLSVDPDEQEYNNQYAAYLYQMNGDYYRVNQVTQEDIQYIYEANLMNMAIFQHLYGPGGENEVPVSQLQQEFEKSFTRSQFLVWSKKDAATQQPLTDEQLTAMRTEAQEYLERAKEEGQSFSDLVHELDQRRAKDAGEADDFDKAEEGAYDVFLKNGAGHYPPAYESYVQEAEENTIELMEDDDFIFIIYKLPVKEADEISGEYYRSQLLQELKYEEYLKSMEGWGDEVTPEFNNAALNAYTPKKLKMTYEQVQAALVDEAKTSSSAPDSSTPDSSSPGSSQEESSGSEEAKG